MRYVLAGLAFALTTSAALACRSDADCNVGGKCAKPMGSIYGVCAAGLVSSNNHSAQPVQAPQI